MAHYNPVVTTKMLDVGLGFARQLLGAGDSTPWQEATAVLGPGGCGFMGAACKPSDDEATTRGRITDLAASPLSAYCIAVLGPNEPNDSDFPWTGASNLVKHMYWTADQMASVSWPHRGGGGAGVNAPPLWGPAHKRNFSHADDPDGTRYEDDIDASATATYNPGGGAIGLADLADPAQFDCPIVGLDHHQYWGDSSPGDRVNGQDAYGVVPAGVTLSGIDGKCSRADFEIGLGGRLIPGLPMRARSEFGHEDAGGNQQHSLYDQETFLRMYQRGIYGCAYEFIDEGPSNPNGSGNWFGMYNLSSGPKPLYALTKTLCGYGGGASFSGVAGFAPISGNPLDTVPIVLPKTGGGWDVYILWEARTSTDLICTPGHHVVGKNRTSKDSFGNKHYTISAAGDTMTVVSVA